MNKTCLTALVILLVTIMSLQQSSETDASGQVVDLAQGKPYSIAVKSPDQSEQNQEASYPDAGGTELTDGLLASSNNFWDPRYTGWYKQGERIITIDLQSSNFIHGIHIHLLQDLASGVYFPEKLTFEVSNDGVVWTGAGHVSPVQTNPLKAEWFVLSGLEKTGRYVRIHIPVNIWVFSDEIRITGSAGQEEKLSSSKPYTISAAFPDSLLTADESGYPDAGGELTDGVLGSGTLSDPAWQGWLRQDMRHITLDLQNESTIHQIRMRFFQNKGASIGFPEYVRYDISDDKINWRTLGEVPTGINRSEPGALTQWFALDNLNDSGRYIRAAVPAGVWVFADELEVYGGYGVHEGSTPAGGTPDVQSDKGYPAGNMRQLLVYAGHYPQDPSFATWTQEHFRRYAGYVNTNGDITDTMFNSFLFLPAEITAPSGRRFDESGTPSNKEDWDYMLDCFFAANEQIDALNKAAGEVRQAK